MATAPLSLFLQYRGGSHNFWSLQYSLVLSIPYQTWLPCETYQEKLKIPTLKVNIKLFAFLNAKENIIFPVSNAAHV